MKEKKKDEGYHFRAVPLDDGSWDFVEVGRPKKKVSLSDALWALFGVGVFSYSVVLILGSVGGVLSLWGGFG